jgi:hypothetical protein
MRATQRAPRADTAAVAAFACGVVAYVAVYDPLAGTAQVSAVFDVFTASGFSMVVTASAYCLMATVPAVRRYLLRDRADGAAVR